MEDFNLDDGRLYQKAREKVRKLREFYINLMMYCAVIPILVFINLWYVPEFHWFFFPMAGWGIGLLFHAFEVFDWNPFLGKNWEDKKIKELLEKDNDKSQKIN